MQLTVKTLKGEKFSIAVEETNSIAEVKSIIETTKSELPSSSMKLIHSGKVLKDTDTIAACNIESNSFLVVMITKAKKPAAVAVAAPAAAPMPATPSPATDPTTPAAPERSSAAPATNTTTTNTTTTTEAPAVDPPVAVDAPSSPAAATTTATATTTAPSASASTDEFPLETVNSLIAMGFPEPEVRACLTAAQGNPDMAVEYLMNGIPTYAQPQTTNDGGGGNEGAAAAGTSSTTTTAGEAPLQQLRRHPQINQLRQLVQSNPDSLQAVLQQIGQQQPDLLREINGNQALFLEIMNEPVSAASAAEAPVAAVTAPTAGGAIPPSGAGAAMGAATAAGLEGMQNPAQMAQMLQGMNPEELAAMAQMMGLTSEQLQMTMQMMSRMPQEELQEYMNQAMAANGGRGGAGGMGGAPPGGAVLRLTEEEMAAVDRLADMGFDRTEAAQAYIACDKNEALAANLLMDGGFGFGAGDNTMGGNGGNNGGGNDDDMYD